MIDVGDAHKTFPVKTGLPNKEIGHEGVAEKGEDFLSPPTRRGIVLCCDENARGPSPIGGATKTRVDDFPSIDPRFFVVDWPDI